MSKRLSNLLLSRDELYLKLSRIKMKINEKNKLIMKLRGKKAKIKPVNVKVREDYNLYSRKVGILRNNGVIKPLEAKTKLYYKSRINISIFDIYYLIRERIIKGWTINNQYFLDAVSVDKDIKAFLSKNINKDEAGEVFRINWSSDKSYRMYNKLPKVENFQIKTFKEMQYFLINKDNKFENILSGKIVK